MFQRGRHEWLARETEALNSALQSGQHVTLSGLERLYRTEDGTLGFVAEPDSGERHAAPGLIRSPGLTTTHNLPKPFRHRG